MNTTIPVHPVGSAPDFPNLFIMFWSLLNILIPLAIVALIFWYLKKQNDDKKRLFDKLDSLISLLQPKKNHED